MADASTAADPRQDRPATDLERVAALDLNLLAPLLAILEERSVTRAAERIHLSQPATSHALRRIRHLLGDRILVRQGNQSVLTPRAAALQGPLTRLVHEAASLLGGDSFDPATDRRVITLAMTNSTAYVAGPHIGRAIAAAAPHATLRILTTAGASDTAFTHDHADAMFIPRAAHTDHPRERLINDRWVVLSGEPFHEPVLEALRRRPHVVADAPQDPIPYRVLAEQGVEVKVRTRVSDNLLLAHLVIGTPQVAIHRHLVAEAMAHTSELYVAEFPFAVPALGVDAVWNPWLTDAEYKNWLRDTIRSTLP